MSDEKLLTKLSKPPRKPAKNYIELLGEEARETFAGHKIHVVTALHNGQSPDYIVYHCCRIGHDNSKIYGSDWILSKCGHTTIMTGDLGFCAWHGALEILEQMVKDFLNTCRQIPDAIQIKETKKTKGEQRYTKRCVLQYHALQWFFEHWRTRSNYHIAIGTSHSDPTLKVIPVSWPAFPQEKHRCHCHPV